MKTMKILLVTVLICFSMFINGCGGGGGGGGVAPAGVAPVVNYQQLTLADGQDLTVQASLPEVRVAIPGVASSTARYDMVYTDGVTAATNGGSCAPGVLTCYVKIDLASAGSFDSTTTNLQNLILEVQNSQTSMKVATLTLQVPTRTAAMGLVSTHHQ